VKKTNLKRCAIAAAVGAAVAICVYYTRYNLLIEQEDILHPAFQALSDACFASGILLACAGGLMWITNDGLFTIFSFGISCLFSVFHRKDSDIRRKQTFAEYKASKLEKQVPFGFLLLVGGTFLLLSLGTCPLCL